MIIIFYLQMCYKIEIKIINYIHIVCLLFSYLDLLRNVLKMMTDLSDHHCYFVKMKTFLVLNFL